MRWDEEVAKNEKVCPMTLRFGDGGRSLGNKCVGSECMAWRGSQTVPEPGSFRLVVEGLKKVGADEGVETSSKGSGFCGLAGPPEVGA